MGVEHIHIARDTVDVLQLCQFQIVAGRRLEFFHRGAYLFHFADRDNGVVHLLEGAEYALLVLQHLLLITGLCRFQVRPVLGEADEGLGQSANNVPCAAFQQGGDLIALESQVASQGNPGEHIGFSDTDPGVGGLKRQLGLAHIGASLEQGRGQAYRQRLRQVLVAQVRATGNLARIFTQQHGQVAFLDLDLSLKVRDERLRAGHFHLCLVVGGLGCQSSLITQLGEAYALTPGGQGLLHDRELAVEGPQLVIVGGHFGDDGHLEGTNILYRGEILGDGGLVGPAQAAPKVELPRVDELGAMLRVWLGVITAIVQLLFSEVDIRLDVGEEICERDPPGGHHLLEACRRDIHVLIVLERLMDQLAQRLILIETFPGDVGYRRAVALGCRLDLIWQVQLGACVAFAHLARGK